MSMPTQQHGARLDSISRGANGLSPDRPPASPNAGRPAANGGAANGGEDDQTLIKWRGATFDRQSSSNNTNTHPSTAITTTTRNPTASISSNEVADFFSPEVFQIVLHNPTTAHQLLKFSQTRFCGENMEFLDKVDRYMTLLDELTKTMSEIYRSFTSVEAPRQLNLPFAMMKRMNADIKTTTLTTLPAMELIFSDAQVNVEKLLATDVYPRFVKHQITMSAVKALSLDRDKYAGLGDCFCLTNPLIADNPIVYASDGFVKVTGYSRTDIIPRNCRFLQGSYTDNSAVKRLRTAIDANRESVELLLNYRKNGEPFWNLLYVAPLMDRHGRVVYFLGGQINCSTTIHNRSDIVRVLSISDEDAAEDVPLASPPIQPAKNPRGFFRAFRSQGHGKVATTRDHEAGMEQDLINRIEKMNLKNQMKVFYSAYSKYLVLSYDSLTVQFFSAGVIDMLCVDPKSDADFVGSDVFKVLTQHSAYPVKDFRNRVKATLRMGRAISAELVLSIRRSGMIMRGTEKLATHWTPLKDEVGQVKSVVVTLATIIQNW
ncbi:MAG: hypothetical protein LQ347_003896 [Umbilicaria vellea]|nr:MAG: hypothetical protein LQ347_003896 [Umbilicaria vellea]